MSREVKHIKLTSRSGQPMVFNAEAILEVYQIPAGTRLILDFTDFEDGRQARAVVAESVEAVWELIRD